MSTPLVVIVPADDRAALREAGVLPESWFRDVGVPGWDDEGPVVRLWAAEPDPEAEGERPGEPPLPARLLGLSGAGRSAAEDGRLVERFFDATVLHVVFLDGGDGDAPGGHSAVVRVGIEPIRRAARLARELDRSVSFWHSEEAARNIRHLALVVVRGGRDGDALARVFASADDLGFLQGEFSGKGTLRTCYFVDGRLKRDDRIGSPYAREVWPVLAGRLLLRLLIALDRGEADGILLPGVHVWRSFEFLFDYPDGTMDDLAKKDLVKAYRKMEEQTDASARQGPDGSGRKTGGSRNEETETFSGLTAALPAERQLVVQPVGDWHLYPVEQTVSMVSDDASRWGSVFKTARGSFAELERKVFRSGRPDPSVRSEEEIFTSVSEDPRNVAVERRRLDEPGHPTDTINYEDVYRLWKQVVDEEKKRQKAKKLLSEDAKELMLAQDHYVTRPYGMLVAGAVSLFCGITIFFALLSFGGKGAAPVSLFFAALSAVGAFAAWLIVGFVHRRSGRAAAELFVEEAKNVDACMKARHEKAVETIRKAETKHRETVRFAAWAALRRLLSRVGTILSHELESPSPNAFYRTEEPGTAERPKSLQTDDPRDRFLERTRFPERINSESTRWGVRQNANLVIDKAFPEKAGDSLSEDGALPSFPDFWRKTCEESDRFARGNLPATTLVPAIRHWIGLLCARLSAARKADLLSSRNAAGPLPDSLEVLQNENGFPLATAEVSIPNLLVERPDSQVFLFEGADRTQQAAIEAQAMGFLEGAGATLHIPVSATSVLNGLRQIALYFQDIRIRGFDLADGGRLVFSDGGGAEARAGTSR